MYSISYSKLNSLLRDAKQYGMMHDVSKYSNGTTSSLDMLDRFLKICQTQGEPPCVKVGSGFPKIKKTTACSPEKILF